MDFLNNIALGFGVALRPSNLLFCLVGVLVGTLVGVLPGIGPLATMAMLLPLTFYLDPTAALIMLAGIYYGSQYGGSTTAILVNMPGEASSMVTCIDGHAMAKRGRAGAALAIAALASLFAGTVATFLIWLASPSLSKVAISFTSTEYFSLMVLGLVGAVVLAQGSLLKAIGMVVLGLFLGLIGTDVNSGVVRYTFGLVELGDGIDFVPIAMGLLGLTEVIRNLEHPQQHKTAAVVGRLWPTCEETQQAIPAAVRGTAIGCVLGLLPGGGALLSAFASYTVERRMGRDPTAFGRGAVAGVAGPEAANNAGAQTSFIPMLTLGVPSNAVMAVMIGALMIAGLTPGPRVMVDHPDLFWGLIASMWVGNLMLVVLNLPLIGIWVSLLNAPYRLLFPSILLICAIGVYSVNYSTLDVSILCAFTLLGYILHKLGCEPAPLALGFVLGPLMEENLRRAMSLAGGDPTIFIRSSISLALLLITALMVLLIALPKFRRTREVAFQEE